MTGLASCFLLSGFEEGIFYQWGGDELIDNNRGENAGVDDGPKGREGALGQKT
ncbi:MAG: hypothetical protein QF713_04145 [Dehalococcoidales bacterium]|nr:hypothetical protein [Dehalococcoidales bacterium]MDP7525509.1 hypothetical protein [Dehalococcoidales bacterium]